MCGGEVIQHNHYHTTYVTEYNTKKELVNAVQILIDQVQEQKQQIEKLTYVVDLLLQKEEQQGLSTVLDVPPIQLAEPEQIVEFSLILVKDKDKVVIP